MIDAKRLQSDGYDLDEIVDMCYDLLETLSERSTPESVTMSIELENLQEDCKNLLDKQQ